MVSKKFSLILPHRKNASSLSRGYRRDIDGLRAVAVLSVIAFHLHFSPISGGYVGVDIFFVISGYLITAILMKDFTQGTFSLAKFYERRARRILPALFLVLLVTVALSYIVYFWTKTSYFVADGPLLHTWSLAVEEQFYLIFPPLLMLIRSLP